MGIAPERHPLADREQGRALVLGSDEGHRARERPPAPLADGPALHREAASGQGQEPGQGAQERGLAGGVRSHEGHRFPRVEEEVGPVEHAGFAPVHDDLAGLEKAPAHERPSLDRSATRK
jgi:hypothetical protein